MSKILQAENNSFRLFCPAAFFESAQDTDYRAGNSVSHKTAEQANRRIDRREYEHHHHHQHRHEGHFIMEIDIFKTVV